jgi:transcriptional regulator with XRE-family HTH domain
MNVIMPIFSARLKELRKEKKRTQKDMAELLNCTDRHYQRIEYGQINVPSLDLVTLADYFDVSADYLLGLDDHRKRR